MAKKDNQILLAIAAIIVLGYLIFQNSQQKNKIKELENEREDLKKLLAAINGSNSFDEEMKKTLIALCKKYENIDSKIANEIAEAIQLLQIGQQENAIKSLVKIMEHLLTRKLENDNSFVSWLTNKKKKKQNLQDMLDYAKEQKLIDTDEYNFFLAVKTIRNKEAHEVGYNAARAIKAAGILCALHGIFKLSELIYPSNFNKLN